MTADNGHEPAIRRQPDAPFVGIPNETARDPHLSWEAAGMLVYLLSLPPGWTLHPSHLVKARKGGRDRIYRILRELRELGYIERIEQRDDAGKVVGYEYISRFSPLPGLPDTALPDTANTHTTKKEVHKDRFLGEDPGAAAPHQPLSEVPKQEKPADELERDDTERQAVATVFEAWKATDAERFKLRKRATKQAREKILARLREGMRVDDLVLAVTAWPLDDWSVRADACGIPTLLMNEERALKWVELGRKHAARRRAQARKYEPVDYDAIRRHNDANREATAAAIEEARQGSNGHATVTRLRPAASGEDIWR
jgi:hypothetical protein